MSFSAWPIINPNGWKSSWIWFSISGMCPKRRIWIAFACLHLTAIAPLARGEVPDALEPDYSEAVLAYKAGELKKASELLEALIPKAPGTMEFLELKALVMRASNDDAGAQKVYLALIQAKKREKRPDSELAPYYFDMALLLHRSGKIPMAGNYFKAALKHGFNAGVCHMYLGMSAFGGGDWGNAESHFERVLASDTAALKPSAYLYLGQAQLKLKYASGATRNFVEARAAARSVLDSTSSDSESRKMAEQVHASTEKALAPYDSGQLFAHLGLTSGYDSNVLAIPSTSTSSAEASGKSTVKSTLVAGVGYASSSLKAFQFVPSYKGSFNYNMNRMSRSAEFVNNIASLYLNVNPLSRFGFGLKLEGALTFKNDVDTSTDKATFRIYSKTAAIGPYLRFQPSRQWLTGAELSGEPRSYDQDPDSGELRRSGLGTSLRLWAQMDRGARYLNPGASFKLISDDTNGSEYRMQGYALELSNALRFTDRFSVSAAFSHGGSFYKDRSSGARIDRALGLQGVGTFKLKPKWTLLANVELNRNSSNLVDLYEYDRTAFGGGVTYSF